MGVEGQLRNGVFEVNFSGEFFHDEDPRTKPSQILRSKLELQNSDT